MLQDLAALTPPAIVCAAFLIGVIWFLRRQMGATGPSDSSAEQDIPQSNSGDDDADSAATDSAPAPSSDPRHS